MSERPRVLLVDDDANIINAARRVLRKHVDLDTAGDAQEALETLKAAAPFTVMVSDHNMPGMTGASLFAQAARDWPSMTRIMFTGDQDRDIAAQAVNSGQVFRFLNKPCGPEDLLLAITEGHRHHQLLTAERDLLERTLSGSVKVLVDVLALSHPRAFALSQRTRAWATQMLGVLKWPRAWEIGLAAMLWPLGDITLPDELVRKRDAGEPLSPQDKAALAQAPEAAHALIANIPRLAGVAEIIRRCRQSYDGDGPPGDGLAGSAQPEGARLLRVLIDLAAKAPVDTPDCIANARRALAESAHLYDPDVLAALSCLEHQHGGAGRGEQKTLNVMLLREGDIVASDITTREGGLLLAAGSALTAPMIQKLRHIKTMGSLRDDIHIHRAE